MSRRRLGATCVLGAALLASAASAAPARAAGPPSVAVAPNTDLQNGQYIQVSWSNYKPLFPVYMLQCIAEPSDPSTDCTTNTENGQALQSYSLSDGSGMALFPVSTGTEPEGFTCDEATSCTVYVTPNVNSLAKAAGATVAFASSPDSCPAPTGSIALGSGEEGSVGVMTRWEVAECGPPDSLAVDYTETSSPVGRDQFAEGLSDSGISYAVTGNPFTADQLDQLQQNHQTYAYAPLAASSVVLAYNIHHIGTDGSATSQVFDLKLTPDNVALLLTRQINNLRDPRIEENNPGATDWNTRSAVYGMGYASAANEELTSWLWATAESSWSEFCQCTDPGEIFPPIQGDNLLSSIELVGSTMDTAAIQDPTSAYFAWMDASTAAFYGLPTAEIENANGEFVAATPDSVATALSHAATDDDGVTVTPDYATPVAGAYPMPFVSYFIAPTNGIDGDTGDVLRSFLTYAKADGQANLPPGYMALNASGMPDGFLKATAKAIGEIPSAAHPSPSPSRSPSSNPASVPTFDSSGPGTTGFDDQSSFPPVTLPPSSSGTGPCATTSPSPSSSPSPSPSATPSSSPSPSPSPSPCPSPSGSDVGEAAPSSTLSSPSARLVLPVLFGLALVGLALGPVLQRQGRERAAAAAGDTAPSTADASEAVTTKKGWRQRLRRAPRAHPDGDPPQAERPA